MGSIHSVQKDAAEQLNVPQHCVDMLLGVMRPYPPSLARAAGSVDYARAAQSEARMYVERIWREAWHAGAAWSLARAPGRIQVDCPTDGCRLTGLASTTKPAPPLEEPA